MKVLVTGGAGYIGSFVLRKLLEANYEPIALDNLSTGFREAVGGCKLIEADLLDTSALSSVFKEHSFGYVIHLAAHSQVRESLENPYKYFRNNVSGTLNLLEAMSQNGVKRLVFASTCAVYGNPKELPVTEDSPIDVRSVYAETKYMCERMIGWYDMIGGIKAVALRFFNVGGASLDGNRGEFSPVSERLIPNIIKGALTDGVFRLFGTDYETPDGTCVRDYIHVEDIADAHVRALSFLSKSHKSEIFNLGIGRGYSNKEIIQEVERQSEKKLNVVPMPRRKGDPAQIWADNTKAVRDLFWEPRYGLHDIIQTSLYWQAKHPNGYSN